MNIFQARALDMFDAFAEMPDEEQAHALAALRQADAPLHDALVRLLVADALGHTLDTPPWTLHGHEACLGQ